MADSNQQIEPPATPGNHIEAQILRWKLTRWTLTVAVCMLGVAWWIDSGTQPTLLYLENFSWIAGIALLVMGLWLLLFGKIHFFWLIDIGLKQERPAFYVGFPLFNIRISESWTKGCYRIRRTNMYLVVPTMLRLFVLGYLCYAFFGILDDRYWKVASFVGTFAFGLATWVTHKKWFPGTPDPGALGEAIVDSINGEEKAGAEPIVGDNDISEAAD